MKLATFAFMACAAAFAKDTVLVNRIGPTASELFIAQADGTAKKKLLPASGFDYDASFSADGKWVVFTSERNRSADIYRARVDGSGLEQLTNNSGFNDAASFSPDGQQIAFVSTRDSGNTNIWILDLKTRKVRNLTNSTAPASNFRPSWSPDGKWIAYRVWSAQEHGLRILNVEDGSITKLTSDYDNFPMWSPKGDRIGFTRAGKNAFDIFTIKPDGTGLMQLTDAPGNDAHCAWSPDGKYILFSSSRLGFRDEAPLYDGAPQPYSELFIMNADGSGQRPVTDDKWEQGTPAWVPKAVAERGLRSSR